MAEVKHFSGWLRAELRRREMNESDLARALETTPSVVNRWVHGDRVPSPKSCAQLADVWGLSPDFVLTLAGHRPHVEPMAADDPRAELIAMLETIRLDVDNREDTLRRMFENFVRQDRKRTEYIANERDDRRIGADDPTMLSK